MENGFRREAHERNSIIIESIWAQSVVHNSSYIEGNTTASTRTLSASERVGSP